MSKAFSVGTAKAAPGEAARGVIPVGRGFDGPIAIPVIVIRGERDGPVLWIDGATHGDEPEGPIACWNLAREVDPRELAGTVVLVPILNMGAAQVPSRGNPFDPVTFDLNRIFPGKETGWPTERLAWAYSEECAAKADAAISIHSGGATSYLAEIVYYNSVPSSIELAKAFGPGWDLLVKPAYAPGPTDEKKEPGTLGALLAAKGKPCLTPELGGIADTLPNRLLGNARQLADGCLNVMRHLRMLPGDAKRNGKWKLVREWIVMADVGGFWLPDSGFRFKQQVPKGTVIARIVDAYGDTLQEIRTPTDGETHGIRTKHAVTLPGDWCVFFGEILEEVQD